MTKTFSQSRIVLSSALCLAGVFLVAISFAAPEPKAIRTTALERNPLIAGHPRASANAVNSPGWSVITSPNTSSSQQNFLYAVTCVSPSDCWAVGDHASGENGYGVSWTLTEHWNGTSWSIIDSPNGNLARNNTPTGIACISSTDCWAVGYYYNDIYVNGYPESHAQALIEHWDGVSWSIVDDNSRATDDYYLWDVSCASPVNCWAAGSDDGPIKRTLIEHWDGTSWSIANSPSTCCALVGVTCNSTSDCWAVGYTQTVSDGTGDIPPGYGVHHILTEHWDGSSWQIISAPDAVATTHNQLNAITCTSAVNCWAVGYYGANALNSIFEQWNGNSWQIVYPANSDPATLVDVTCNSESDCWAVGSGRAPGSTSFSPSMQHWNGISWQLVTAPSKSSTTDNFIAGVACSESFRCLAVGHALNTMGVEETLIEGYFPTVPPLIGIASRIIHGAAGTFDVDLPLTGTPGIECRSGGASSDYTLIFTFVNPLTSVDGASVTSGDGSVSSSNIDSSDAHNYIVNLTGVTNAQVITVGLTNVADSAGNSSSIIAASMGVLLGDTTANGSVNASDISQTKAQSGQVATSSNFRTDVNVNGLINSSDISLVKSKSGTALP